MQTKSVMNTDDSSEESGNNDDDDDDLVTHKQMEAAEKVYVIYADWLTEASWLQILFLRRVSDWHLASGASMCSPSS